MRKVALFSTKNFKLICARQPPRLSDTFREGERMDADRIATASEFRIEFRRIDTASHKRAAFNHVIPIIFIAAQGWITARGRAGT